jgi:SAM-dependent methyltransferase
MNWKNKAHILAVLSRVPFGRQIYHKMQRSVRTNQLDAKLEIRKASEIIQLMKEAKRTPRNANILEIGTGWRPFVPMMLSLLNAKSILTIDVNPWLDEEYAFETFECIGSHLELIAKECGVDINSIEHRYQEMVPDKKTLTSLLDSCRIDYLCPGDARKTDIPDETIDFVVSSNVLEHIPAEILSEILVESKRILKQNGFAVHRFNPQDHYSESDNSITGANFLQFSEKEWKWYGGTGLAYHNRLRCRDYENLFEQNGFKFEVNRVRMDQKALNAIHANELSIHDDYKNYSPEELAADYMWVVAGKMDSSSINNYKKESLQNK